MNLVKLETQLAGFYQEGICQTRWKRAMVFRALPGTAELKPCLEPASSTETREKLPMKSWGSQVLHLQYKCELEISLNFWPTRLKWNCLSWFLAPIYMEVYVTGGSHMNLPPELLLFGWVKKKKKKKQSKDLKCSFNEMKIQFSLNETISKTSKPLHRQGSKIYKHSLKKKKVQQNKRKLSTLKGPEENNRRNRPTLNVDIWIIKYRI